MLATQVGAVLGPGPCQRGLCRKHILAAVEDALRRLSTGHIGRYLFSPLGPAHPIEETVLTLHDVVRAGKVRYLVAGSMHAWQFATAVHTARRFGGSPFVSMQNQHHLA